MKLVQLWFGADDRMVGNNECHGTKTIGQLRLHLRDEPLLRVYLGNTSGPLGRAQLTLAVNKPRRTAGFYGEIGECLGPVPECRGVEAGVGAPTHGGHGEIDVQWWRASALAPRTPMKILVDIPDGATVGTATVMNTGGPEPGPGPTPPPPNPTPPPAAGDQPSPFGGTLPVQNLGTLTPGQGQHTFVPSSQFITTVQLTADFRNGGFSSPPPVFQGCAVAVGSVPGGSDIVGWEMGSDNANVAFNPPSGAGTWLSMVLNPTHPQPPGTSYYSAN